MTNEQLDRRVFDRMRMEGFSVIVVNSAMRIVREIGWDKFPNSSEADWLAAYRKARPQSSVDIGVLRRKALKFAKAQVNVIRAEEAALLREQAAKKAETERLEAERRAREAEEARLAREAEEAANPMFSVARIKALNDWVELNPEISAVDFRGIEAFMKCFKVKGEQNATA